MQKNKIIIAAVIFLALSLLQASLVNTQGAKPASKQPASRAQNSAPLDLLYREALTAVECQDWMQALIKLERIQFLRPDYRDVANLLAVSRARLLQQAQAAGSGAAFNGVELALLAAGASLLALLFWLPVNRARLHRWLGNHARAAMIYEHLVFRKPSRTKFYVPLAEAYLRLNRRDATAMRIYKRVLELNLATALRAELHNLVTGYNLDEMQTKWHVHQVLDARLEKNLTRRLETPPPAKPLVPENSKRAPKPEKKEEILADYGYTGGLFCNGKLQIEKY